MSVSPQQQATVAAGNDSLVDTPTSYGTDTGVGGSVRGNYATLNPLDSKLNDNGTISNGNLQYAQSSTGARTGRASIGVLSGKWYWELTADNSGNSNVGVTNSLSNLGTYIGADANGWGYVASGSKSNNGETAYGSSWTSGDIIGVALNMDAGTITFYKNNVSQGTAFSGLSGTLFPSVGTSNISTCSFTVNFGQRAFAYTAPSGFKALCDTNLGAPLVAKPNTLMDVALYTGNGGTQTISGLAFEPDLVWFKSRNNAYSHALVDVLRGGNKVLYSNATDADVTMTGGISAWNNDGFTAVVDTTYANSINTSSSTVVAWCWKAIGNDGTASTTNTAGSITSQVRANATAGFSVVTYTGTGAVATVGHGLGVAPQLIIARPRNAGSNWVVYHASEGAGKFLRLNTTDSSTTDSTAWNNTTPTSTVYSVGNNAANGSGLSVIAYCFAPVVGYSSMGSYVGNASSDGPFVYTGFRPKFLLFKSAGAGDWVIIDATRDTYNVSGYNLYPNDSVGESFNARLDILSNGFKLRSTFTSTNPSGTSVVYAAFAESPFQYARAR